MSQSMSAHDRTERRAGYIFILIFALMAIGVAMGGSVYYLNYERNFRVQVENDLSNIAKLKAGELALWRGERLGDGAVLFKNATFSALVRRFLEKPEDTDARTRLQSWMGKYITAYHYMDVYLVDTQGQIRISVPQPPGPHVSSVARDVTEILRSGQVTLKDFHRDAPDGPVHLAVVVPIFDDLDDSRPLGVLALSIDPKTYLYSFIASWPTSSETGETLLVRRDGDDALFLSELRFHENAPLNLRIPLTKTEVPAVRAALGQEGVFKGVDYRGAPVIAAARAVPGSPWVMVARMNTSEVYGPVRERLWETVAFAGVLLFGSGAAMGIIWRQKSARYMERDKAAEAVRVAEERYRSIFAQAADGIWLIDAQTGAIVEFNAKAHESLGYTREEFGKIRIADIESVETADEIAGHMRKVMEEGSDVFETKHRARNGETRDILVSANLITMGGRKHLQSITRDITDRKRMEAALRESEQKFLRFFMMVPVPLGVVNNDGVITYFNGRFTEVFGYTRQDVPTIKEWWERAYPDESYRSWVLDTWGAAVAKAAKEGTQIEPIEYKVTCKNGEERLVLIGGAILEDSVLATFVDITDRKRAESDLILAKERAEAATKLKDQFVSLVAHDLRSPFASMMGLLKDFAEHKPCLANDEDQKVLHLVFESGDRMMTMIDQLLKISRLQTGQITPHFRFFKGYMAVAVAMESLSHSAAQKGIVMINEVPVDMRLYADPSLFDEVLLNLLSNAIKFCSRGDKITVLAPPGLKSAIAVRDTGKGISEKIMPDIFKHDVKTTTTGTDGEPGSGLGLPYSHDIMRAHGGELTVESAPGKGTVFCVMLPYVRPVALIVDDDPVTLMVTRRYLEKIGIDVIEALDAEKALSAMKERRPHIIITDIIMPGMDGFALLDRLKQESATRGIPVIVMTSTNGEAREKALRRGADDFVSKPVEVDDFIPRVRRFVG